MPRYNKTGPNGAGPMTGRGLGKCGPNEDKLSSVGQVVSRIRRSFKRSETRSDKTD